MAAKVRCIAPNSGLISAYHSGVCQVGHVHVGTSPNPAMPAPRGSLSTDADFEGS